MTLEEFDKLCDRLEERIKPIVTRLDKVIDDHEERVRQLEWKAAYLAGGIAAAIALAGRAIYLVVK
jgi:hypothetical protein